MLQKIRVGAIGALLDEYERSITELIKVLTKMPDAFLPVIINAETTDEDCKTVQAILSHIVHSGYGYACSIHNLKEIKIERPAKVFYLTIPEYLKAITTMFLFTENVFKNINDIEIEELNN